MYVMVNGGKRWKWHMQLLTVTIATMNMEREENYVERGDPRTKVYVAKECKNIIDRQE